MAPEPKCPRIAVVDHGTGNLTSLVRAFERMGADVDRCSTGEAIVAADGIVLPGVGAFPRAMESLRGLGLEDPIRATADAGRPVLGVCLGMQLLFEGSSEMGGDEGLGLLEGTVVPLDAGSERLPHIGWTPVSWTKDHALIRSLPDPCPMYHVHSFVASPADPDDVLGRASHGTQFVTAVGRGTVAGVQFHPEKSSLDGLSLVANFVRLVAESR